MCMEFKSSDQFYANLMAEISRTEEEMKINYGLIAVGPPGEDCCGDVLHFCGYEEKPTEAVREDLVRELATDPEFGLSDRTDYVVIEAPPEVVEVYRGVVANMEITENG